MRAYTHHFRTFESHLFGFKAVRHLRTLLSLILTNSEVRKLLSDFSVIGRDLLAKAATRAAEAIRPGDEEVAHVDEPASGPEFVPKTGETPVLNVDIPRADVQVEQYSGADEPAVKTGQGEEAIRSEGQQVVRSAREPPTEAGKRSAEPPQKTKESVETQR